MAHPLRGLKEGSSFIGQLTTTGRVTGKPHRVPLRLIYHRGKVYASRTDALSDWCRNLLRNPKVTLEIEGRKFTGRASQVTDEAVSREVSQLKYGEERRQEKRIVIEITLERE